MGGDIIWTLLKQFWRHTTLYITCGTSHWTARCIIRCPTIVSSKVEASIYPWLICFDTAWNNKGLLQLYEKIFFETYRGTCLVSVQLPSALWRSIVSWQTAPLLSQLADEVVCCTSIQTLSGKKQVHFPPVLKRNKNFHVAIACTIHQVLNCSKWKWTFVS